MKRRDKHQWMLDRINDFYFIKAKKEGYRARSAYKLIEIEEKFHILPKNGNILDLGCAPGAWLQVIKKFNKTSQIFGIDLLEITPIENIKFLKADIFDKKAEEFLENIKFDLILSDIAPNCCGVKEIDHLKLINLAEKVFEITVKKLNKHGNFCIKIFDGTDAQNFIKEVKKYFLNIKFFKPKASHLESNEFYLICQNFK